jgi:hypothetical protein
MNEACSAGTGSFIEEQGKKFAGVDNVVQLGAEALGASCGVSLGQHCSVFMAEIIDEAVASHVPQRNIIAGIYDSIIQNYLNRVKGSRSVGQVVFCQGMPFSSNALAAAVVRQTGAEVVVPNLGTVGARHRALAPRAFSARPASRRGASSREVEEGRSLPLDAGCGGRQAPYRLLTTVVVGKGSASWGGGCSMYDKGRPEAPDRA